MAFVFQNLDRARTVLQLSAGKPALSNITFLVAHNNLSWEELFIGLPFLQHLRVDIRTVPEQQLPQ